MRGDRALQSPAASVTGGIRQVVVRRDGAQLRTSVDDIAAQARLVEPQQAARCRQPVPAERSACDRQGAPQGGAGVRLVVLGPEQRGERVARLRLAGHRQVGEQRDGLARIGLDGDSVDLDDRRAQQSQGEPPGRVDEGGSGGHGGTRVPHREAVRNETRGASVLVTVAEHRNVPVAVRR